MAVISLTYYTYYTYYDLLLLVFDPRLGSIARGSYGAPPGDAVTWGFDPL